MKEKHQIWLFLIIDIIVYIALLGWLYVPVFYPVPVIKLELMKYTLNPIMFKEAIKLTGMIYYYASYFLFLVPAAFVYKVLSMFLKYKSPRLFSPLSYFSFIVNFILSGLILAYITIFILNNAGSIDYFKTFDTFTDIIIGMLIIFSILQPFNAIDKFRGLSVSYRRYLELTVSSTSKHYKSNLPRQLNGLGILPKLFASFILAITLIIVFLSYILLAGFKDTIQESVIATGSMLADQSVSYIKDNLSTEKLFFINSYLKKEAIKNKKSSMAFDSMSWYNEDPKRGTYNIKLSTDEKLIGKELSPEYESIEEPTPSYDKNNQTFNIIAPIKVSTKKIGFSIVQYKESEIYKTYYKTQLSVVLFSLMIIYLAVILVYLIGSNIVLPILLLQYGVKRIGATLAAMIKGTEKVQAGALQYENEIKTKDEIRTLSYEVNNMVTVIKGIIPYISASTLQHSDRIEKTSVIKDLTFLFTDVRGFTSMSEGKPPDEVVNILNHYLDLQTQIILDNGGDIDKFVGDEVMAVFDGAEKEKNAAKACLAIIRSMQDEKDRREADNLPVVEIGIGINSGEAVFGSMGARERMDFTCIGDNVNLAARLEGANKAYNSRCLVTESVYNKIHDNFLCREIDFMTVKGKKEPVRIYEIMNEIGEGVNNYSDLIEQFGKGLKLYRETKWEEAKAVFKEIASRFHDGPSAVFYNRCNIFKKNPPASDWDGVFSLTVK